MSVIKFTLAERLELIRLHKLEPCRSVADRIKTLLLLDSGWSYKAIAEALLLDDQTIRNYEKKYLEAGFDGLILDGYKGGIGKLTPEQELLLKEHVKSCYYHDSKELILYVKESFGKDYSTTGVVDLLHRLGFVYKKSKVVPEKANIEAQKEFVEKYRKLKESKGPEDKILFMDGTHPHYNSKASYCWVLRGEDKEVPAKTGRERVNLNGAVDIETCEAIVREDVTINAQSTIELFRQIEAKYQDSSRVNIITDNAKYYRARQVTEYLKNSKINLIFLPPYSPNLNLIERLWKFFNKKMLYRCAYKNFQEFRQASIAFFKNLSRYKHELKTLLADNFQLIGNMKC